MQEGYPTGAPSLPDDLAQLLTTPGTLNALLIEKGERSSAIIQKLAEEMERHPERQEESLTGLIRAMGYFEATNQRGAAFEIIKNPLLARMITLHSHAIHASYLDVVGRQTSEGSMAPDSPIRVLLDAGIALSPYLAWDAKREWREVRMAWNALADRYPGLNQQFNIRLDFLEMYERRSPDPVLDWRVQDLRNSRRNITAKEIAKKAPASESAVNTSIARLIRDERVRKLNARSPEQQARHEKIKQEVDRLLANDIRPQIIAKLLNIDANKVYAARSELAIEKEIAKRSHEENT
ncbi:hypothetical protein HY623_00730 [Candidatus Uhrbacteria bacterium]|nr:hypothetical protein [Candidatus Uhrbacteria bacterium]